MQQSLIYSSMYWTATDICVCPYLYFVFDPDNGTYVYGRCQRQGNGHFDVVQNAVVSGRN